MGSSHGPLVLTLILDAQTQNTLNALRKKWFPPNRNMLGAHVTLFHAIPPHRLAELEGHVHELCGKGEDGGAGGSGGSGHEAVNGHASHQASHKRDNHDADGSQRGDKHASGHRTTNRAVPQGGFDVRFHKPIKMGSRGVMLNMQQKPSGVVQRIHRELLKRLKAGIKEEKDHLTNQDQMKLVHPHVTVLNKEDDKERVQECLKDLEGLEVQGKALGIEVWEYQGGPWRPMHKIMF